MKKYLVLARVTSSLTGCGRRDGTVVGHGRKSVQGEGSTDPAPKPEEGAKRGGMGGEQSFYLHTNGAGEPVQFRRPAH